MHGAHDFLQALAVVLCVAAITTVVFQRLRQPVVLGYILAGVIVGPNVPIPLVADMGIVQTLSEVGVILLMFSLGLEFSLRKLFAVGPGAGATAIIQCSLLLWLGYVIARGFGWTTQESIFTGAIICVSSTTIIAKVFDEQGIRGRLRDLVVGVLIVEDLIAILLMAILTALASGTGLSASSLAVTGMRLLAFLSILLIVGLFIVPRTMRFVVRIGRDETTLVASIGICFAIALFALEFGYSVALGAFLAGSLIAESGQAHEVERLVQPVRDVFAAVFFVSVGMLIDPTQLLEYAIPITVITLTVILGKLVSVGIGAFLTGNGIRTSVQAGMSLAQIGEFSFIIAGLGRALGATGDFLYPVAVAVSAITTLTTPWLIRVSGSLASFVEHSLPKPMQTFAVLYGSWWDRLGTASSDEPRSVSRVHHLVRLLLIDALVISVLAFAGAIGRPRLAPVVSEYLSVSLQTAHVLVLIANVILALPFAIGIVRVSRSLSYALAARAFPEAEPGGLDFAAAARRAMVVSLQIVFALAVAMPLVAITQPVLGGSGSALLVAGLLGILLISLWRSTTNLDAHVRAGAQVVVEALARQSAGAGEEHSMEDVHRLLPGIGEPETVRIPPGGLAVGKSLAELDLRATTGATVLAISRDGAGIAVPQATEVLRAGDILAVAGTQEAILAARELLSRRP
ncbi:MAG TPA: cation:proton antiporter [Candidatus Binatia bacterium]